MRARLLLLVVITAAAASILGPAPRGRPIAHAATNLGPINTAIIAANFSDSTTPIDVNAIRTAFQGNPGADVVSYFNEASYGKMQIVPSFFGPYALSTTSSAGASAAT